MTRFRRLRTRTLTLAACAAVAIALYAAFCFPALRHFSVAIPYSSYAGEKSPLMLEQGDHLQLLYHFDLFDAYLKGDLPWFRNLWEFNTSDEARPSRFDTCYAPFALPYSLLRSAGATDAAAWNLCQLLSVFLGVVFTFALARRFRAGRVSSLAVAAVSSCVPYRWVVLTGGSPTGFGMGLVPAIALGIDIAVRDEKLRGGILAAAALASCYAADLHCYLFGVLSVPLCLLVSLLRGKGNALRSKDAFRRTAFAFSPVVLAGAATAALGMLAKRAYAGTDASGGRTMSDIARHSPDWHAFFDPFYFSHSPEQFHMGYVLPALLAVSCLAVGFAWFRSGRKNTGGAAAVALVAAATIFAFFLAMGVNGPVEGLPIRIVRKLVPPFRLVRQPLKAFCLLPTFYSVIFAAGCTALRGLVSRRVRPLSLAAAFAVPLATYVSVSGGMHTGTCLLPGRNSAYDSVVRDALERGFDKPRALALPIWPGDSSWSSIYQYCAAQSHLRMLNGYAAVVDKAYFANVFRAFETMTEGEITDTHLQKLAEMGVSAVILHENAFPPKVSMFPFGTTLRRFLADRRLRLLASDAGAWAFAIDANAPRDGRAATDGQAFLPPFYQPTKTFTLDPPSTNAAVRIRTFAGIHEKGFGWLVRSLRRAGSGQTAFLSWTEAGRAGDDLKVGFVPSGVSPISNVSYTAEKYWTITPRADGSLPISVADMVHNAGETILSAPDATQDGLRKPVALQFRPDTFRPGEVAYGPDLPLPLPSDDVFRAELDAETDGADGSPTAALWISGADGCETLDCFPAGSPRPNAIVIRHDGTTPVRFRVSAEPRDRAETLRSVVLKPVQWQQHH